jgi:hypothetical protein
MEREREKRLQTWLIRIIFVSAYCTKGTVVRANAKLTFSTIELFTSKSASKVEGLTVSNR